jgi:hypothetical protein
MPEMHTRGATPIALFQSQMGKPRHWRHTIHHIVAACKGHFFLVIALPGNHPPVPTCPPQHRRLYALMADFLRPAAHEGVLRRRIPFRTFTLLRIAVGRQSHTIFVQRGSAFIVLYVLRIAADWGNVNKSLTASTNSIVLASPP